MKGLIGIIFLVLDVIAIIDCLKSNKTAGKKALWIIVVLFVPLVGVILYYTVGRK